MNIINILNLAVQRIGSDMIRNEAQVKRSVIEPVFKELGWDIENPEEFATEFTVQMPDGKTGRADYALISGGRPVCFVEAKRLGYADSGMDQLFGYANNQGIPMLILTDGNVWEFYLSQAPGPPEERMFYRMELQDTEKISGHAEFLQKFVIKDQLGTRDARWSAENLIELSRRKQQARDAIPCTWKQLLASPDDDLCALVADAVEQECEIRPEIDDVVAFLQDVLSQRGTAIVATTPQTRRPDVTSGPASPPQGPANLKVVGFALDGHQVRTGVGYRTLAAVIKEFDERDPEFMDRFAAQTAGRSRRLVARSQDELYDVAHLKRFALDLENGWWLGTNLGSVSIAKHIRTACEVAQIAFGSRLTLIEE